MNFVATATEFILWLWMYFSVLLSVLNLSIKNFYNIITVLLWVSIRSLFCNHTHFSPTTQNITSSWTCHMLLAKRPLYSERCHEIVAERTSYFCLARKLIWPLWSSHIFTQWGWLILFNPDHFPGQHENGESPPNYLFLRTFQEGRT